MFLILCINIYQLCGFKFSFGYYARFKIGPLERTWGITLGNLLRRVLIGNISGIEIKDVKFFVKGEELLKNEFSIFPTIKESKFEILENLKKIILISERDYISSISEEPLVVKQKVQGPSQIFAKDFSFPKFLILRNPGLYIGTINFDEILELHLILNLKGKSLVQKANFKVEEEVDGKVHEQIFLEIWTLGETSPRSVLKKALFEVSNILNELISGF